MLKDSLWRNRNFLFLMSGQTISTLGSGISGIAAPFLILALTHSPAQAGLAAALEALPFILFSLPAGALLDRWDRKRAMIICDIGRALNLATLLLALFAGHLTIEQIYLNSFIEGAFFVFFSSAETAALPQVVQKAQLPSAYSTDQMLANSASFIGPSLGGLLYGLNWSLPFVADVVSYIISFVSLFWIRTPFQQVRTGQKRHLVQEIIRGLSYLWRHPLFRFMAFYGGGLLGVLATQDLLVIVLAQRQHASAWMIGMVLTGGSAGGILGSMLGGIVQKHLSFGQLIIGLTWLLALLWLLYAVAVNLFLLALITCTISLVDPLISVIYMSYRMAHTPDEMRSRLNSTHRLIAFSMRPLGTTLAGFLLQYAGSTFTILTFTSLLLVLGSITLLNVHVHQAPAL
jgi:predicted MFS family arabinose efflux permease